MPNGPCASWLSPPDLATSAANSWRTSSHSPLVLGAAKAISWRALSPRRTVTHTPVPSAISTSTLMPSYAGTSRLPKSIRSRSGKLPAPSHGPDP